jgi:hypothetical protein
MPRSEGRAESCGNADALGAAVRLAQQTHADPALVSAAARAIGFELEVQRRAIDGAALFELPACERITELQARLAESNEHDDSVRELRESNSQVDLQRRWAETEALGACRGKDSGVDRHCGRG